MLEAVLAALFGALAKILTDWFAASKAAAAAKERNDAETRMREANARPRDPADVVERLRRGGL